jgi:hypothetical protein
MIITSKTNESQKPFNWNSSLDETSEKRQLRGHSDVSGLINSDRPKSSRIDLGVQLHAQKLRHGDDGLGDKHRAGIGSVEGGERCVVLDTESFEDSKNQILDLSKVAVRDLSKFMKYRRKKNMYT